MAKTAESVEELVSRIERGKLRPPEMQCRHVQSSSRSLMSRKPDQHSHV